MRAQPYLKFVEGRGNRRRLKLGEKDEDWVEGRLKGRQRSPTDLDGDRGRPQLAANHIKESRVFLKEGARRQSPILGAELVVAVSLHPKDPRHEGAEQ